MDVPRSWAPGSAICIRATSADGLYSGEGAAVLPSEPPPRLEVRLKSDYPKEFAKGILAGQFIVRIDRTTCENAATRGGGGVSGDEESGAELSAVAIAQWIGSSAERALIVHVDSGAASLVTASLEGAEGRLTDVIECDARDSGQTYDHECRTDLENVPPQEATLGVERIRTGGARRPGKAAPRPSATRMTRWPFAVLGGAVLLLAALTFLFQPCGAVPCRSGRNR